MSSQEQQQWGGNRPSTPQYFPEPTADTTQSHGLPTPQVYPPLNNTYSMPQGVKRHNEPINAKRRKVKKQRKSLIDRQALLYNASTDPITYYDAFHRPASTKKITKLHIYDFDNTLFKSPCPNPGLFQDGTLGMLTSSEHLATGGWWREPLVLRNLGEGWIKESERAWEGFWNEDIVELLNMSLDDDETATIVMTGRRKNLFAGLIQEILKSKGLFEDLDGLMLRQGDFATTIEYKTQVLVDLLNYFTDVKEVILYDDRRSQLNGFEKCLNEYTEAVRPHLITNLVPVFTEPCYLEPKIERKLVEEILETHNSMVMKNKTSGAKLAKCALRKSNLYTSYFIEYDTKATIIEHLIQAFPDVFKDDFFNTFKFQIDHIPIVRGLVSRALQTELKEKPQEVEWRSTHIGVSDTHIALSLEPVIPEYIIKTLQTPPLLPIAAKGKNSSRPTEEYATITEWRVLKPEDQVTFISRLSNIINFKIIHDGGPLKGMKKKKTLDADQQAELP